MKKTDEKIRQICDFMTEYSQENGYPPSIREICAKMNFKSTSTAQYYIDKMKSIGLVNVDTSKKRTLSFIKDDMPFRKIPLIGTVTAGLPITAVENFEGYYPVPEEFISQDEMFMLRVKGNSMINAGIFNGDKIIVKKQNTAENGDIVVAFFDDGVTVKRFYKEQNHFRLHPENPEFSDIILDEVTILGVVNGLIRKM